MISVLLEALVKSTSDKKGISMKNAINKFNPATNWITTGLLTLVVTSFGIFAESHASEREITFKDVRTDVTASISTHAEKLLTVCDRS
jgi:hypothetical protein